MKSSPQLGDKAMTERAIGLGDDQALEISGAIYSDFLICVCA